MRGRGSRERRRNIKGGGKEQEEGEGLVDGKWIGGGTCKKEREREKGVGDGRVEGIK